MSATKAPENTRDLLPDCPHCGSPVELVLDGMIGQRFAPAFHRKGAELPVRWRLAAFGACTGCELCVEINPTREPIWKGSPR